LSNGTGDGKVTVIVPGVKAVVTGAENTRVRTPLVPLPVVTSASLVYVLSALSATVTFEVELDGSMATVTKIVFPTGTVEEGVTRRVSPAEVSLAVAMVAAVIAPGTLRTRAPEAGETFATGVRLSVAVAVMLCVNDRE